MAYPPQKFYTPEEYLTFERADASKHEYLNGEILATARVSARHVLIVTNLRVGLTVEARAVQSLFGSVACENRSRAVHIL